MTVDVQQPNNEESKYQDILYVVSREIHELSDAEENNEKINLKWLDESITENFETELKNALKDKPQIVDQLLSACESYIRNNPDYCDDEFNKIYSTLLNMKGEKGEKVTQPEPFDVSELTKDKAEINADNINVTLRGKWSMKSWMEETKNYTNGESYSDFLKKEKQKIADQLTSYVNNRENLSNDQKTVLILTKHALESTSKENEAKEPVSGEVLVLERKLNELGYMPLEADSENCHNGVDGKFGTKTYEAILKCMENEGPKPNAVSDADNLKSGEYLSNNVDNKNPNIAQLQLSTLNEEQAKELATYNGSLDLAITEIDTPVATALAKHKGILKLDKLKSINKDSAAALSQHKGAELHLGLTTIDSDIATALAEHTTKLYLNSLTEIDAPVATALAKHKGTELYLDGLTRIDSSIATKLVTYKGHLNLAGIDKSTLDQTTIGILQTYKGTIQLKDGPFNVEEVDNNSVVINTNESNDILVEGTITFKELRDKLPITNNGEINKIMGSIDYFDKKLNEGKSINELAAEELKLNEELNNIERQIQEVEGKKGNFDKEKGKERRELEKTTNYLKKQQEALKKRQNEINEEKNKKVDIKDKNILVLIRTLTNELTKNATDDNNDAVVSFINETIPEYIKGLDGQTEKKVATKQTDKLKGAPDATPNAPKKSRQEAFKEQLENFNKATHQFVKILADRWGSLFPDSKSAKKLNTLSQQYEFEDKMKENQYIEKDGNVYKILLGLKGITDAEKADGFEEIMNVIENGDENQVRELQMKLWTPANNLPITGRIDKNTSNLLKNYITKAPKGGKESLSYQCFAEGGYEEAGKINDTEKNIAGTVYKKGESGSETYIFIGELNGETCICENINYDPNKTITITDNAKIHRANGEIESGEFDTNRKLTKGTRYNPDGTKKETVPTETT